METLRVDFNRRRNGRIVSSVARASGPLSMGDIVEVYQPGEDDMTSRAMVAAISEDGRVELEIVNVTVHDADVATRFMSDLLSWYSTAHTSEVAAQSSNYYNPVDSTRQSWRPRVRAAI